MHKEQMAGEEHMPGASVRARVAKDSSFNLAYAVMNVLAAVVASYGLLSNSAAVVIGAMVIAMLLGPISGVGLALVDGNTRLLARASASLGGGVLLVLLTAFLIGLFNRDIPATREMLARTSPQMFDLMIALGGGAAGAYAATSQRLSGAFVGVAIATALVPPLSTSSMFLARGELALSGGALLLAFTNIVAIQFSSSVVFFLAGFRKITRRRSIDETTLAGNIVSISVLAALGVLLSYNLQHMVETQLYENQVHNAIKANLLNYPGTYLAEARFTYAAESVTVRAVVRGPKPFTARQVATMEENLPATREHARSTLLVRYVRTTVMSASGPLFSSDAAEEDDGGP